MSQSKFRIRLLAIAISVFSAGQPLLASEAYDKSEKKLFNGETLTEFKLANGLRVLWVPRHQAKVLTFQTWFDVGSVDEKLDPQLKKTGLAHLFEHMMFRGSEKYPDGKFDEITARLGGDKQNASTYYYRTNYFENVPSSQLEKIMELESDRMRNLKLTKEIFEKEKGAVVGELRRSLDNPSRLASDELMRLVYNTAPFRYTVIGTEEEIRGFTLEEAQHFYKTFYAPNNATLIIIGDAEEKPLMKLVGKYYGEMKVQPRAKAVVPVEPEQTKERKMSTTHKQATSEILTIGYRTPGVDSPDVVSLLLLSTHLSQGMEARLRKILVDTGTAVGAMAGVSNQPDLFEFQVQLAEGQKAEKAIAVIDKEIASLQTKPISKESFERALNQELLKLYSDIGDNAELGNWLGEYLMLSGNYLRGFEIIEAYKKLTVADLQKAAKTYLVKKNRSVVIVRAAKKETP